MIGNVFQKTLARIWKAFQSKAQNVTSPHGISDLAIVCRHAGRNTVSVDDVMLLARRNEGLEAVLRSFLNKQQPGKGKATTRK